MIRSPLNHKAAMRWSLLLLFMLLSTHMHGNVTAQTPSTYAGLDIIFLVDQSGSMGGNRYDGPSLYGDGNDALDLRFEAVQYALDTLGQYRLTFAPDIPMQMAVVNFGDEAQIAMDWQQIAQNADAAAWDQQVQTLLDSLSPQAFIDLRGTSPANLGNTNFVSAFERARSLFDVLPNDPAQPHLRAVVMVTDGAPCVPAQFDCEDNDISDEVAHMSSVAELSTAAFPDPDYRIYVIALDDTGELWRVWEDRWVDVTGSTDLAGRAENNQQVGVRIREIVLDLVSRVRGLPGTTQDALPQGDNIIDVPPYLREIRVSIFKSNRQPGVLQVTRPDGSPLASDQVEITGADRPIEVWTLEQPDPGAWVFTVNNDVDRFDVFLDFIPLDVNATILDGPFVQFDNVTMNLSLTDSNGQPLPEYPQYPLQVNANVTSPGGQQVTRLALTRIEQGLYTDTLQVLTSGEYIVEVQAFTLSATGEEIVIFGPRQIDTFTVLGITFDADNLPTSEYLVGEVLQLQATLSDENGQPLNLPGIGVSARLIFGNTSQTTQFTPVVGTAGAYNVEIPLNEAGEFQLQLAATSTAPSGDVTTLGQPLNSTFTVIPSVPVQVQRVSPENDTISQNTTGGFPPITPTDIELVFDVVRTDDNTRLPLESVSDSPNTLWDITLFRDGQPFTGVENLTVEPDPDAAGRYRVTIPDPGTGAFDLQVTASGTLRDQYIIDANADTATVIVNRSISLFYYGFWASIGLLGLVAVLGMATRIRNGVVRSGHPARGKIALREIESGIIVWEENLDRYNRNYIVFKDSKLRNAGIGQLTVTCDDERDHSNRRVSLTAKTKKEILFSNRKLSPGHTLRVSRERFDFGDASPDEISYELVKDPDDPGF